MRKLLVMFTVVAALLMSSCPGEQPPETVKTYTLEQFHKTTGIFGGSFSPDESKLLVTSNETGIFNAFVIDIATGERTPVTDSDADAIFTIGYFPEDERILYSSDKGGNEINHIYLLEPDGTVTELTEGEETKEQFGLFTKDKKSFYTVNNSRDPRFFDFYEWDIETLESKMVFENTTGMNPASVSPDRRWLALSKPNTTNDRDIYLVDLQEGGDPVLISEHEGMAEFAVSDFGPEGKYLYYTSDADGEFDVLKRYDLETGMHEEVYATDWDVSFSYLSDKGTYHVIGINADGYTKITILNTATGETVDIPNLPAGDISGLEFSRSEKIMRFYSVSDNAPSNLFVYNFETGELKQLTDTLNPEIDPNDLIACEVVRFNARDGMEIPGLLYKPKVASAANKVPALLWIHGGPGGQSRPFYNSERQFYINHGYAIFAVNNRGSSGYGKSFLAADDHKHGHEPLWDCVDAKEFLKTYDWIDPERIGIFGGSYGGYMVLAALAFQPEEFAVGVDIFGVANWVRTLRSIPSWWEAMRQAYHQELGNPETEEDYLRSISPVFHADKITRPLIILQGANDPRVLQAESDDMVAAIKANDGIVEYVVFEDEGHGFVKKENRIEGYNKVLEFLDKYLKGVSGDEEAEES